jgi:hypothetical protein
MKKCRRGKGIRFTASFLRSELSWPGNLRQQVTPLIVAEIRWFRSPTVTKINNSMSTQHLNHCCDAERMQRQAVEKHKQSSCQKTTSTPQGKKKQS